ncbi:hypothetical protein TKK_0013566 [Trichogramma kaykai]
MAQDHRMRRFFKGLAKLRPSRPKYDVTWDPKIALDYYSKLGKKKQLSLQDLTQKLICLLALVTGHRMQTFSLIQVENISISKKQIEIKIPDSIKTSGRGKLQPVLIIPFGIRNKNICVATTIQDYLEITRESRGEIKSLFISCKRPIRAVSTQTLCRWMKKALSKCGINTDIFSAHSTRHASTSAAKRSGVNIDLIRKAADWTKNSQTFARFYDLNIIENNDAFARAILNC